MGEQLKPASSRHLSEHPSNIRRFPSSHSSMSLSLFKFGVFRGGITILSVAIIVAV